MQILINWFLEIWSKAPFISRNSTDVTFLFSLSICISFINDKTVSIADLFICNDRVVDMAMVWVGLGFGVLGSQPVRVRVHFLAHPTQPKK